MNSEELEKSLRGEFENYLKDRFEELQKGVSEFQQKINEDFEKQKEHLDSSFRELNEKIGSGEGLEESFTESVTEHLKLARDEGARITANAIAEAEKLDEAKGPEIDVSVLSEAVEDISSKTSQSDILKALVGHASDFTPRGAFFIVKNEHLVGWRVFGREDHEDPKVVREVFFPVASDTALSEAVRTLSTINSTIQDGEDDVMYRNKLGFEGDSKLHAIPLVARGRGVAVLYADSGENNGNVDVSAIKALMKVAGLTVEVLASQPAQGRNEEEAESVERVEEHHAAVEPVAEESAIEENAPATFASDTDYAPVPQPDTSEVEAPIHQPMESFESPEPTGFEVSETDASTWTPEEEPMESVETVETAEVNADEIPSLSSFAQAEEFTTEVEEETPSYTFEANEAEIDETDYSFDSDSFDTSDVDASDYSFEAPAETEPIEETEDFTPAEEYTPEVETFAPAEAVEAPSESEVDISRFDTEPLEDPIATEEAPSEFDFSVPASPAEVEEEIQATLPETAPVVEEPQAAESVEVAEVEQVEVEEPAAAAEEVAPKVRSRFADRNLDLPIEVGEDERRFHNDARRFARLLVSEIKLYNEQKVKEGRESSDLYERLREAIDRSREMYDKRVQAPVAAKFDYFNYELVNTLAEGDEGKLGSSYPGPSI